MIALHDRSEEGWEGVAGATPKMPSPPVTGQCVADQPVIPTRYPTRYPYRGTAG
jgi:hypothetical protein